MSQISLDLACVISKDDRGILTVLGGTLWECQHQGRVRVQLSTTWAEWDLATETWHEVTSELRGYKSE